MSLANHITRKSVITQNIANIALILAGSLLIAASAQVRVYLPNTPVPVTMQTLAVLLLGATLGPWRGLAAAAVYVAAGSMGLPFFAGLNGGALSLLGPTGGYLFGFIISAGFVGWIVGKNRSLSLVKSFLVFSAGHLVIYLFGTLWLSQFVGGFEQAIMSGIVPFVIGDLVKLLAASLLFPAIVRLIQPAK